MAYTYYRSITVDHTKVPSTQTDFPVLVSFTHADLKTIGNGGHVQNTNGYDIGFFSDSALTTPLYWEVQSYNATTGKLVAWVKISSLSSSSDTVFYMGYGDSGISTFQSTASSVWNTPYEAVLHLSDGSTASAVDSTSNGNNGSIGSGISASGGTVTSALAFTGSGQIGFGDVLDVNSDSFTISQWVTYGSSPGNYPYTISKAPQSDVGGPYWFILLYPGSAGADAGKVLVGLDDGAGHTASLKSSSSFSDSSPHHIFWVVDRGGSSMELFIDGSSQGTASISTIGSIADAYSTRIGDRDASAHNYLTGNIGETRFARTARASSYNVTEYNNQSSPSTFFTLGSEVPNSSGQPTIRRYSKSDLRRFHNGRQGVLTH